MKYILLFTYIFVVIDNYIDADTLILERDKLIIDYNNLYLKQIIKGVEDINKYLDGYLIIELPIIEKTYSVIRFNKVYYCDDLNKIHYDNLLINTRFDIISDASYYEGINDSIDNNFRIILKCLNAFNKNKILDLNSFSFDNKNNFNTNLLEKSLLVEKFSKQYFIFKIKFTALIYEYYVDKLMILKKTLIPISKLKQFEPAELEELEMYGFKKSETVVKFIE